MLALLVAAFLSADGGTTDGGTALGPCRETVEICFSPDGACDTKVVAFIGRQKTSLDIEIYSLNRESIVNAILQAKATKPGLVVRLIIDTSQIIDPKELSALQRLQAAKIPMKRDTRQGIMHNKVMIGDRKEFSTGSFNFTNNAAENNDENLLIWDCPKNAQTYQARFDKLWAQFKDANEYITSKVALARATDAGRVDAGSF